MTLSVVSTNVNGVRAAHRNGGLDWLLAANAAGDADIICMQEVRAEPEILLSVLDAAGFQGFNVLHAASAKKGHAGVAIISRLPLSHRRTEIGPKRFDNQGRWIEAAVETSIGSIAVASVYVHTGDHEKPEKQAEKEAFLATMTKQMSAVAKAGDTHALYVGDLNVGHTERDIKNWKGNIGRAGFLESERKHFTAWFDKQGWVDLGRAHAGDVPGPYTWWSQRGQAFDTDTGWRIDYQVATPALAATLIDVRVAKANSYAERWSDHAPLIARFDIDPVG